MGIKISNTQKALQLMIKFLKASTGKIRHVDLAKMVRDSGGFTEGNINGAFNQLRDKGKELNVKHERIAGGSYFEYVRSTNNTAKKVSVKNQVKELTETFLNDLNDLKKEVNTSEDFELVQGIINKVTPLV